MILGAPSQNFSQDPLWCGQTSINLMSLCILHSLIQLPVQQWQSEQPKHLSRIKLHLRYKNATEVQNTVQIQSSFLKV